MRILAVTNMYPTPALPTLGVFVEQQIRSLGKAGISVSVMFLDRVREGPRVYGRLRSSLPPQIGDFDPHLIHVMYGGVMAERVTALVEDRPVVVTYHGSDLQGAPGAGRVRRTMAQFGVWSSRRAARRASGIVVVAEHLREYLPAGVGPDRVEVIACGIDLERFRPMDGRACGARLGWNPEGFHVLFATNNRDPIKRPELARSAVDALSRKGVPAELHVMNGVPYEDVPIWLNAADALLMTSRREGSPTIVKEALACNRPIVSVAVGDIATQTARIEGCHIREATPQSLAEGLEQVYRGSRRVLGREAVAEQSLERTAQRLEKFYERILARWAQGSSVARSEATTDRRAAASTH